MRALLLFVSGICFAVHKKRDMIPFDANDGQRSSFHAMEIYVLLHPSTCTFLRRFNSSFLLDFSKGVGG
jgi:hypothetical protein